MLLWLANHSSFKKMSVALMSLIPSLLVGVSGCLFFYIASFYYKVSRLPKGPTPLPFIGNILTFRSADAVHQVFDAWAAKYSPIYTIYLGPKPIVIISDSKLGVETMRKVTFAGRPDYGITQLMFEDNSIDVFFADFSREWEVLKKVAHEAIKKYTSSQRHPFLVSNVVDRIFDRKDADGKRMEMVAQNDFSLMLNAILASAAFGKNYEFDDTEFLSWKRSIEQQGTGQGQLVLILFVPFLKYVFRDMWSRFEREKDFQNKFIKRRYNENLESFDGM